MRPKYLEQKPSKRSPRALHSRVPSVAHQWPAAKTKTSHGTDHKERQLRRFDWPDRCWWIQWPGNSADWAQSAIVTARLVKKKGMLVKKIPTLNRTHREYIMDNRENNPHRFLSSSSSSFLFSYSLTQYEST